MLSCQGEICALYYRGMKLDVYPIKLYFRKLPIGGFFGLGLILNIFAWVWVWMNAPHDVQDVFLHYNILFGVDLIGPVWRMYMVPLSGLIILLVNTIAGWLLFKKDQFIAMLLVFIAAFIHIFLIIHTFLLALLNA